jgi:hypothetical protein
VSSLVSEAEEVRVAISRSTGANFEIRNPHEDVPTRELSADWYIRCREITKANKIPYVSSLWREKEEVRIESMTIGNTSVWIEEDGGEEAVYPVLEKDLRDFSDPVFRREFLKGFPGLKGRLGRCQAILDRVSKKHKAKLEIEFDGGKGLAVFYIDARVEVVPKDIGLEIKRIENAVKALKEAYNLIALV